ncbi:MAG: hypothetical protein R3C02_20555 [Planctomycetaceae bacterium]
MIEQRRMPELPIASDGNMPVPVYDCHVILSAPDDNGLIHARVSTLPEITASGQSEQHILQTIVKDFEIGPHPLSRSRRIPGKTPQNRKQVKPNAGCRCICEWV